MSECAQDTWDVEMAHLLLSFITLYAYNLIYVDRLLKNEINEILLIEWDGQRPVTWKLLFLLICLKQWQSRGPANANFLFLHLIVQE